MCFSPAPRILLCPITVLLLITASPTRAQSQATSGPQSASPFHTPPLAADQEQFISYWTTEAGWQSELELRNDMSAQELTVTPVLRTPDGTETPLAPVTIKPQDVKTIDLKAAAIGAAPQLISAYGSVVLRYHSTDSRNLFAMIMIRNTSHSVAYHLDAIGEIQENHAGSLEGVWWLPNDTASDYLVLANQGSNPLQIDLSLYDSTGKEAKQKLTLASRTTNRLSVRQLVRAAGLTGSYGGLKVYTPSHAGSLDSLHILFDEKASFSALTKMFDQSPTTTLEERDFARTKIWTLRAPMLALTHPDPALALPDGIILQPQIFVRNTPYTFGTDAAHPNPVYLSDNTYVWQTDIYRIVLDNLLTALPSPVNVNENWTTSVVPDYSGTTWRQPLPDSLGCASITGAELKDEIFGEDPSRVPTPVYSANPNGAAVQHWGQEWRIGTCTIGSGPRVETNTLQKYTDHAAYTGVTTPAP